MNINKALWVAIALLEREIDRLEVLSFDEPFKPGEESQVDKELSESYGAFHKIQQFIYTLES